MNRNDVIEVDVLAPSIVKVDVPIKKIEVNGVEQQIVDKTVNISVPTRVSQLSNDENYQTNVQVANSIEEYVENNLGNVDNTSDINKPVSTAQQNAINAVQSNLDEVNDQIMTKINANVEIDTSIRTDGDNVYINLSKQNLNTGNRFSKETQIPLASEEEAGLMSTADVSALNDLQQRVGNLESKTTRLLYTTSTNPTSEDINNFVTELGYESPFEGVAVVIRGTFHIWHYYQNDEIGWHDDGVDTVNLFTNETAGIIKGENIDGKIYAENDGTGSVVGWGNVLQRITNLENNPSGVSDVQINSESIVDNGIANIETKDTQLIEIDEEVTKNSSNLITSGAVASALENIPKGSENYNDLENIPIINTNLNNANIKLENTLSVGDEFKKFYFNTSLTPQEVVDIINNVEYSLVIESIKRYDATLLEGDAKNDSNSFSNYSLFSVSKFSIKNDLESYGIYKNEDTYRYQISVFNISKEPVFDYIDMSNFTEAEIDLLKSNMRLYQGWIYAEYSGTQDFTFTITKINDEELTKTLVSNKDIFFTSQNTFEPIENTYYRHIVTVENNIEVGSVISRIYFNESLSQQQVCEELEKINWDEIPEETLGEFGNLKFKRKLIILTGNENLDKLYVIKFMDENNITEYYITNGDVFLDEGILLFDGSLDYDEEYLGWEFESSLPVIPSKTVTEINDKDIWKNLISDSSFGSKEFENGIIYLFKNNKFIPINGSNDEPAPTPEPVIEPKNYNDLHNQPITNYYYDNEIRNIVGFDTIASLVPQNPTNIGDEITYLYTNQVLPAYATYQLIRSYFDWSQAKQDDVFGEVIEILTFENSEIKCYAFHVNNTWGITAADTTIFTGINSDDAHWNIPDILDISGLQLKIKDIQQKNVWKYFISDDDIFVRDNTTKFIRYSSEDKTIDDLTLKYNQIYRFGLDKETNQLKAIGSSEITGYNLTLDDDSNAVSKFKITNEDVRPSNNKFVFDFPNESGRLATNVDIYDLDVKYTLELNDIKKLIGNIGSILDNINGEIV